MRAYERLLNYVKIYTTSEEESGVTPSAAREFDLGNVLAEELKEIGVENVRITKNCYVYGEIPATPGMEHIPALGFIAHMDTAPDFSGEGVKPQIIGDYDGSDIRLGDSGRVLSPKAFPDLEKLKGRTLITTDGTTLLGADDKAGIAEIMTMAEQIIKEGIAHGKICIAFTPDEEIGEGADHFDVEGFGAKYAYTVDGGAENEIEFENFNAAGATVKVTGLSVHPGDSKDTMINAALVAMEFNQMLPAGETPRGTKGYEGFFHLTDMSGDVSNATLSYIIRDHDAAHFEIRKEQMQHIADLLNEKYGAGTVVLTVKEQYRNMREKIEECMFLIVYAKEAVQASGLQPETIAIRGGTDGARLSFMGLPCPNLGTGGYAFHGPFEHITTEGMDAVVENLKGIVRAFGEKAV